MKGLIQGNLGWKAYLKLGVFVCGIKIFQIFKIVMNRVIFSPGTYICSTPTLCQIVPFQREDIILHYKYVQILDKSSTIVCSPSCLPSNGPNFNSLAPVLAELVYSSRFSTVWSSFSESLIFSW